MSHSQPSLSAQLTLFTMSCAECRAPAFVYCEADDAYLCASCDFIIHAVNRLASRHVRVTLSDSEIVDAAQSITFVNERARKIECSSLVQSDVDEYASSWDCVVPDIQLTLAADAFVKREAEELAASSGAFILHNGRKELHTELSAVSDVTVKVDTTDRCEYAHELPPERSSEERLRDRRAALQRFRNKRANRSFAKKVRYECRKQLADSRPRVKGRFVKKCEMALYRKYGNAYRDYLHEISAVPDAIAGDASSPVPDYSSNEQLHQVPEAPLPSSPSSPSSPASALSSEP